MELRTQAVDRLLEALAPSLSAELERVVAEVRQQMEQEFQSRLESALREAELATLLPPSGGTLFLKIYPHQILYIPRRSGIPLIALSKKPVMRRSFKWPAMNMQRSEIRGRIARISAGSDFRADMAARASVE